MLLYYFYCSTALHDLHSCPTRRSSDLARAHLLGVAPQSAGIVVQPKARRRHEELHAPDAEPEIAGERSEEHTSELQSPCNLVCRLLLEKKNKRLKAIHDIL